MEQEVVCGRKMRAYLYQRRGMGTVLRCHSEWASSTHHSGGKSSSCRAKGDHGTVVTIPHATTSRRMVELVATTAATHFQTYFLRLYSYRGRTCARYEDPSRHP